MHCFRLMVPWGPPSSPQGRSGPGEGANPLHLGRELPVLKLAPCFSFPSAPGWWGMERGSRRTEPGDTGRRCRRRGCSPAVAAGFLRQVSELRSAGAMEAASPHLGSRGVCLLFLRRKTSTPQGTSEPLSWEVGHESSAGPHGAQSCLWPPGLMAQTPPRVLSGQEPDS